jgi:DNA-binding NtrC family response regulator
MKSKSGRILIVDDEKDFCQILFLLLTSEGFDPIVAHDGQTALAMISQGLPDVVLLDVKMPGVSGIEVLRESGRRNPRLPVIMMTAYGGIDIAVKSIKLGAYDFLTKPFNNDILVQKLREALSQRVHSTPSHDEIAHSAQKEFTNFSEVMGPSAAISRVVQDALLVAPSDFTVIIQGESGTGKELIARFIHKSSKRARGPMIPIDCGAVPETLFESELFGYEKGAFTGANTRNRGKFEMAEGGTLFLDEIGNMPLNCQAKLLRAMQERTFFRIGGRQLVKVDVRLIVATNQDLLAGVAEGSFSRDLFYRLSEFTIHIPPLRERKEDIVYLAKRFLEATNLELNKKVEGFSDATLDLLTGYSWPGNVRQLRSIVRRAVLQADTIICPEHISLEGASLPRNKLPTPNPVDPSWDGSSLKDIVKRLTRELERSVLLHVLKKTNGNKAEAARLLHIDYKTIHSKIRQYRISAHWEASDGEEKQGEVKR